MARENVARTARLLLAKGRPVEAGMAYTDLGEIMQVHGAFLDAEASYKKGLALLSHYTPPSDVRRVIAMDDLGWLYLTWGRLQDGSRLMDQARTHAARITTQDPVMIRHFDTQAAYNLVTGHYSEAHKDWDRALDVGRINFGPESPKYASILVHIAQGSSILGDYKLAEQLLRQYLAVKARGVSATPLELAVAQGELGHVCVQLHRLPEAQSWLDESTKAFNSHPEAAPLERSMVLSYRGDLSMAQHDWADAQWQYREALQIQQNVLGENKVVASSMLSLSKALQKLHLKDQAKQLAARAKAILSLRRDPALENTVDIMALRRQ
ncbi:MAG TPA: tetratricopeptide repeat protein [Bryobacteraceae bacterium]|nr:tetratricopeptide repeat protein [Bryobacteraceae bacterium]